MKKIIIYLATMLLAAMTFTGCYDLETYPGDKVNEGTFYKTSDHAHQGLMGIYGMLRLNEAYGYQFCFDHLGDIAYGYNYYMMFLATYTDRDGTIQAHWQTFYDGIHRVNTFIRSVKGMRGIITDEQINEYVAEAKFLRAMFYFSLTDLFGGVPYYDESTNVNEEFMNLKQPRSSLEEVRAHILEDLDEAIKYLPVELLPANMVVLLKVLPMPFVEKCIFTTKSGSLPSTILKKSSITSPIIMAMLLTMITLVFLNSITGLRAQKRSSLSRTRVVSELSMVCRYRL